MKPSERSLRLENTRLRARLAEPARPREIENSMADLVAGAFRQDNLTSFLPMLTANIYAPLTLNWTALMYMYKTHGLIQTAIDVPVLDAFRGGFEFTSSELDTKDLQELEDFIEENSVWRTLIDSLIWAELFGGAALIINSDQDPEKPLEMRELKKGHFELYDACRWELGSPDRYAESYQFYNVKLHKSRVMTLGGKRAPFTIRRQLAGWGMSKIERVVEDFNLFLRTRNVLYAILDEAKIDVYSIDGFRDALATSSGTEKIRRRINFSNQLKNFERALILDKNDEYHQKQLTFTGIAEVMEENRMGIASAFRMPQNKLFGLQAKGLSSDEESTENYNAMVESEVREPAKPAVRQVLNMLSYVVFGDEYQVSYKWKPLRVMSSKDEQDDKDKRHKRALDLYDRYIITAKELADIEQKEKLIPIEIEASKGTTDEHPQPPQMPGEQGEEKSWPKAK